ncbi:MAG: hypothetical protein ACI304_09055 [Lepagella sp.]
MTATDKKEIVDYLAGPRDCSEGVSLYNRFGMNLRLKRLFLVDNTLTTRDILYEELRKLAGLTDLEYARLPRRAANHSSLNGSSKVQDNPIDESLVYDNAPKYSEASDSTKKMIRFREHYPFLNSDDCPNELKILVADMFTAHGNYKDAHARLSLCQDDDVKSAARECETIVNEYLRNREIRAELEYYREHGSILGKASIFQNQQPTEDLTSLTDMDLIKQMQSASANVSKHKKTVRDANSKGENNNKAEEALAKWMDRKNALKKEIDRRKKK